MGLGKGNRKEIIEKVSFADLPTKGLVGRLYILTNTNLILRWTGSAYENLSGAASIASNLARYDSSLDFPEIGDLDTLYIDLSTSFTYYFAGPGFGNYYIRINIVGIDLNAGSAFSYDLFADFPAEGRANILYIDLSQDAIYYWKTTGNQYVQLNATSLVGISQLAAELKATTALGDVSGANTIINWSLGVQFNLNMTAATELTFNNIVQSKGIMLVVTGNAAYPLTMPAGVDIVSLTDFSTDAGQVNKIYIYCNDSATPDFTTTLITKL